MGNLAPPRLYRGMLHYTIKYVFCRTAVFVFAVATEPVRGYRGRLFMVHPSL